jgi:methyl coenzyme M reductase subunit D
VAPPTQAEQTAKVLKHVVDTLENLIKMVESGEATATVSTSSHRGAKQDSETGKIVHTDQQRLEVDIVSNQSIMVGL